MASTHTCFMFLQRHCVKWCNNQTFFSDMQVKRQMFCVAWKPQTSYYQYLKSFWWHTQHIFNFCPSLSLDTSDKCQRCQVTFFFFLQCNKNSLHDLLGEFRKGRPWKRWFSISEAAAFLNFYLGFLALTVILQCFFFFFFCREVWRCAMLIKTMLSTGYGWKKV